MNIHRKASKYASVACSMVHKTNWIMKEKSKTKSKPSTTFKYINKSDRHLLVLCLNFEREHGKKWRKKTKRNATQLNSTLFDLQILSSWNLLTDYYHYMCIEHWVQNAEYRDNDQIIYNLWLEWGIFKIVVWTVWNDGNGEPNQPNIFYSN